jgi:hypothetical protein
LILTDVLAFNIRAQNAGLLVRKQTDHISFESFELSPTAGSVMGSKGRLRRCFPGPAIAIDPERLDDPLFREAFTQMLAQLDIETPLECIPTASKAGQNHPEIRDTVDPKFVTEMLTGLLRGIGRIHDVVRFHKCTRDDVLWSNALRPWRRSPLWLMIRVALQSTLAVDGNNTCYKSFMIFLMGQILRDVVGLKLSSDFIFVTSAKISRRVLKLDTGGNSAFLDVVERVVSEAHNELASRWNVLESETDSLGLKNASNLSQLCFQEDTQLSLLKLGPYLSRITSRPDLAQITTDFHPSCPSRFLDGAILTQGDAFQPGTDFAARLSVLDLERWVEKSLDAFLNTNQATERNCLLLAELLRNYVRRSASAYKDDPIDISFMLLTCMELWVALDKLAVQRHPILETYAHGFPERLFDPMLLRQRAHMIRLACVEDYLQRRASFKHSASFIFEDCNKPKSLAVRFAQQSDHHVQLQREIEVAATIARGEKKREYVEKTQNYQNLMQKYRSLNCDEATRWDGEEYETYHPRHCVKCQTKCEADSIRISVHEWPLPENDLDAKAAVFELAVPSEIAEWREITYALQVDVFSPQKTCNQNSEKLYVLHEYDPLRGYFNGRRGRLYHASTAKPFMVSHYSAPMKINLATSSNICVPNGLRYATYDSKLSLWTPHTLNQCNIRKICTFQLLPGPFQKLQGMVDGTAHTSNEALARQSECPRNLTLHEFYAFTSLRSGHRLQWRNIARELVSRILRFNQEETHILVIQAAWQAGCVGDDKTYRDSHVDLKELEFGLSFMSALEEIRGTIEGNWQGSVALRTLIVLATRVLSLTRHQKVHQCCYSFLIRARNVARDWGRDIGQLCHEEEDEEALKSLNMRALEISLTCLSSFAVDEEHLHKILQTSDDIADAIESYIIIHDRCPAFIHNLPQPILTLLRGFERTSHFLEAHLRKHIVADPTGIDSIMQRVWSGYQPGISWVALPAPNERWLMTKTSDQNSHSSVTVHYNLLDGTLLVNGLPLTRLPRSYEIHPTYR